MPLITRHRRPHFIGVIIAGRHRGNISSRRDAPRDDSRRRAVFAFDLPSGWRRLPSAGE